MDNGLAARQQGKRPRMFAPMILPTESEACFLRMEMMVVTSSGSEVPMAIIVAAITASGTRITPRSGHPLHPSKIRLVRRMLRDGTGRARALSETIAMRERVDRGEQRYIMPLKPRAHGSIDSFYSAELGVYRPLLRDELERLALPELSDVVEVMRELPDVPADLVPQDSLLREFIGGSTLPY